ncbi:GerAB/ArcD/ProY family transporter [Halalkalibacter urbisdiaboli]|uniref:GerAB/ArcD/ProY family transporter n=1 Tax=Halalkalibacter urbisdiaboli TaxID=1960589 RepID=UPI000B4478A8|nr:GerAB/ArcD/ProY family transporter [Halalkalibacter urbisdiaboli]
MMIRISNIQLFALIITFEIGSTTLFALGIGAKQNAWIVILLASIIGLGLLWVYTQFAKDYPNQNFSTILNELLGPKLAKPLLFLFGIYFINQALHNFYEFGVLIKMTALPRTPILIILYLFIVVTIYILSLGFEVFARTSEILAPYFLTFLILIFLTTVVSGEFDIAGFRPVLGGGFQPVLEELPTVIAFPFGEMVVFLMFFHLVNKPEHIRKVAFWAVGLSAFILMLSLVVMLAVLGPELTANTEIPILETILTINIAEIITNLDSIAVFIMFIGGFYKTGLHFFGFCLAMTWVFNLQKTRWLIIIFGLLLPIFSIYRFSGLDEQRYKGLEGGIYGILLMASLPILLLLISVVKRKKSTRKGV